MQMLVYLSHRTRIEYKTRLLRAFTHWQRFSRRRSENDVVSEVTKVDVAPAGAVSIPTAVREQFDGTATDPNQQHIHRASSLAQVLGSIHASQRMRSLASTFYWWRADAARMKALFSGVESHMEDVTTLLEKRNKGARRVFLFLEARARVEQRRCLHRWRCAVVKSQLSHALYEKHDTPMPAPLGGVSIASSSAAGSFDGPALIEEVASLREEVLALRKMNDSLEHEVYESEQKVMDLEYVVEEKDRQLEEQRQDAPLTNVLMSSDAPGGSESDVNAALVARVAEVEQVLTDKNREVERLVEELRQRDEILLEKDKDAAARKLEIENLQATAESLHKHSQISSNADFKRLLREEEVKHEEEVRPFQNRIQSLEEALKMLSSSHSHELSSMEREMHLIEEALRVTQQERDEALAQAQQAASSIDNSDSGAQHGSVSVEDVGVEAIVRIDTADAQITTDAPQERTASGTMTDVVQSELDRREAELKEALVRAEGEVETLATSLEQAREEFLSLHSQLDDMRTAREHAESLTSEANAEMEEVRGKLARTQAESDRRAAEVELLRQQLVDLTSEKDGTSAGLEALQEQLASAHAREGEVRAILEKQIKETEEAKRVAREQSSIIEDSQAQLESKEGEAQSALEEVSTLRAQNRELQSLLEEANRDAEETTAMYKQAENTRERVLAEERESKEKAEHRIEALKALLSDAEEEAAELEERQHQAEKEWNDALSTAQAALEQASRKHEAEAEEKRSRWQQEKDGLEAALEEVREELLLLRGRYSEQESDIVTRENEKARLQDELDATLSRLSSTETELLESSKHTAELEARGEELQQRVNQLERTAEDEAQRWNEKAVAFERRVASMERERETLRDSNEQLSSKLRTAASGADSAAASLRDQNHDLVEQVRSLEQAVARLEAEVEEKMEETAELNRTVQRDAGRLSEAKRSHSSALSRLLAEKDDLHAQLATAQSRIETQTKEHENTLCRLDEIEKVSRERTTALHEELSRNQDEALQRVEDTHREALKRAADREDEYRRRVEQLQDENRLLNEKVLSTVTGDESRLQVAISEMQQRHKSQLELEQASRVELEAELTARLRNLMGENEAVKNTLASLRDQLVGHREQYNLNVSEVRREAQSAKEEEVSRLRQVYDKQVSRLQSRLKETSEEASSLRAKLASSVPLEELGSFTVGVGGDDASFTAEREEAKRVHEAEVERLTKMYETRLDDLEADTSSRLLQERQFHEREIGRVKALHREQVEMLHGRVSSLESRLTEAEEEAANMRSVAATSLSRPGMSGDGTSKSAYDSPSAITSSAERIEAMQREFDEELRGIADEAKQSIADLNGQLEKVRESLSTAKAENDSLRKETMEKNARIASLEETVALSVSSLAASDSVAVARSNTGDSLNAMLQSGSRAAEDRLTQIERHHVALEQELEGQVSVLTAQVAALRKNNSSLEAKLESRASEHERAQTDLLKRAAEKHDKEMSRLQATYEALIARLKAQSSRRTTSDEQSSVEEDEKEARHTQLLEAARSRIEALEEQNESLREDAMNRSSFLSVAEDKDVRWVLAREKLASILHHQELRRRFAAFHRWRHMTTMNHFHNTVGDLLEDNNALVSSVRSEISIMQDETAGRDKLLATKRIAAVYRSHVRRTLMSAWIRWRLNAAVVRFEERNMMATAPVLLDGHARGRSSPSYARSTISSQIATAETRSKRRSNPYLAGHHGSNNNLVDSNYPKRGTSPAGRRSTSSSSTAAATRRSSSASRRSSSGGRRSTSRGSTGSRREDDSADLYAQAAGLRGRDRTPGGSRAARPRSAPRTPAPAPATTGLEQESDLLDVSSDNPALPEDIRMMSRRHAKQFRKFHEILQLHENQLSHTKHILNRFHSARRSEHTESSSESKRKSALVRRVLGYNSHQPAINSHRSREREREKSTRPSSRVERATNNTNTNEAPEATKEWKPRWERDEYQALSPSSGRNQAPLSVEELADDLHVMLGSGASSEDEDAVAFRRRAASPEQREKIGRFRSYLHDG